MLKVAVMTDTNSGILQNEADKLGIALLPMPVVINGENYLAGVNLTHDECNSEFPEELKDTYPKMVAEMMEAACAKYYHKLPIPAEASVGDHWIH